MKRCMFALLLFALPALGQVTYPPQIRAVQTDPSGTTPCTLPWQYNSADGTAWYPANPSAGSCTWAELAGGGGTPITGTGTANYYALWTGTSTLGNSTTSTSGGVDTNTNVSAAPQFNTTVTSVAYSAAPALVANKGLQTITLTGNAVPTISGIVAGQRITFQICQDSAGSHTWTWPAAVHGGVTIGSTLSTCSMQSFNSFNGTTLVPESTGAINVAP